jgi:vitamin B12 transporter
MSKKLTLLTGLLISCSLFAQKDTLPSKLLDEVIVTANKLEQKQSSTGKVITVIDQSMIQKSSGKTVAQLLNEQVGITINGALNNAGSVQTIFMRGASPGRTLVLMDGIPVNDPSQITGDIDLNFFSLNNVERIEICKGAQSTMYGSDAIAGVINIITIKKNITEPLNIKAGASAGNYDSYKANVQFYGKSGRLTYNTSLATIKTGGFSSAYDSSGNKNFDRDGYAGNIASASIQLQATAPLLIKAFTQYSKYQSDVDASAFTDKTNYTIHNRNFITGTGMVYKQKKLTVTGNYQFNSMHRNYNDNASIPNATAYSMNDYDAVTHFGELFTSITLNDHFHLLSGVDYRYGSMNNQYRSLSVFGPYNSSFRDTSANQQSVYSSLIFQEKAFSIEFGGRWNHHSRYGNNVTYTFNPSWKWNEHLRIFGSIATGYKAPTLYQLYSSNGNLDLQPEKAITYEIGIQQTHKKLTERWVFFYRNTDNGIDFNSISFKYFNYINQTSKGLEYEFTLEPIKKVTLTGNYTWMASEETTQSRVNFSDTSYQYLLRRPKHTVNLIAGYALNELFYVSVQGKYVSSRYDVGAYKKPDVLLNSYFLLGAYATYKIGKKLQVFIDLQNLTHQTFFDLRGYNSIPFLYSAGIKLL